MWSVTTSYVHEKENLLCRFRRQCNTSAFSNLIRFTKQTFLEVIKLLLLYVTLVICSQQMYTLLFLKRKKKSVKSSITKFQMFMLKLALHYVMTVHFIRFLKKFDNFIYFIYFLQLWMTSDKIDDIIQNLNEFYRGKI